jgi:hypothetical protein
MKVCEQRNYTDYLELIFWFARLSSSPPPPLPVLSLPGQAVP